MKVTYKCLPENENRGHSVYDFIEKRGSFGVGTKKWALFLEWTPKNEGHSVCKNAISRQNLQIF